MWRMGVAMRGELPGVDATWGARGRVELNFYPFMSHGCGGCTGHVIWRTIDARWREMKEVGEEGRNIVRHCVANWILVQLNRGAEQ